MNFYLEEGGSTTGGEKTPLVTMKIDSLAKLLFNKSLINSPGGSLKGSPVEDNTNRTPLRLVMSQKLLQQFGDRNNYIFIGQTNVESKKQQPLISVLNFWKEILG